jgi:uncharacterized heparinase superfamily protein
MPDEARKLKPLKVTCTSTDCDNNLHCFRTTRKMKAAGQSGHCRTCNAGLIDWGRVHQRDVSDAQHTFSALRLEMFRHHMWHVEISQRAVNYARRKGKLKLRSAAEKQLRRLIGHSNPPYDGRQTPRETSATANIIHYAQHATASCCRKCLEYWHGIPQNQELTDEEVAYLTDLVMLYVEDRLPDLREHQ